MILTSIENKYLVALRENGDMLYSEAEIVELRSNVRIERIYLLDDIIDKGIIIADDKPEKLMGPRPAWVINHEFNRF